MVRQWIVGLLEPCWRYLSLLNTSWAHFARLAAFVLALGPFLCLLARSELDFGSSREPPGSILEACRPCFSRFLLARTHAIRKRPERRFVLEKNNTKRMSAIQRATPKTCKFDPEACRTALSVQIVLQTCLGGSLGSVLEGSGPLGSSSWVHLAGFWSLLGDSWPLLGASWAHLGRLLGALKRLLAAKNVPGLDFGRFGTLPGWVLEGFRGVFWHAFRCASHS